MMHHLGGTTFIHNGVEHDYCFEESIRSMLAVCDEVVAVEAGSTDDTPARLERLREENPKLRIIKASWLPAPLVYERKVDWTKDLEELARVSLNSAMNLYVQADEILHEAEYDLIRNLASTGKAFIFNRFNFWVDPFHRTPPNRVCSSFVCRLAPRLVQCRWGSEDLDPEGAEQAPIGIYHYGFLREPTAFRKKAEIMHQNFIGCVDPIIYEAEKSGMQALRNSWPESEMLPFKGTHPAIIRPWLKAHGYVV